MTSTNPHTPTPWTPMSLATVDRNGLGKRVVAVLGDVALVAEDDVASWQAAGNAELIAAAVAAA